tara:strand:+ start:74 stop:973 length:900 start_codon:yes stop_codon:yes gene_type:complete
MKPFVFGLLAILATFALSFTAPASAGEQPNILIMGEDSDKDAVPRNNRVFNRVLNALANELDLEGFNVYDEVAVTLEDFDQGRVRRTDAEIIDIAKSVKNPPIDVAVIYTIYASAQEASYTLKIRARVTGRLLNVHSGKRLGNFEVKLPRVINAPTNCARECILEVVGENAKTLAQDLGLVLAKKLDHLSPVKGGDVIAKDGGEAAGLSNAYSLLFRNFTLEEINRIEEYLAAFSGYRHHRPVVASLNTNEYWYETDSESARLNRNLRLMLDLLEADGRVVFSGNQFMVEKIRKRKERD